MAGVGWGNVLSFFGAHLPSEITYTISNSERKWLLPLTFSEDVPEIAMYIHSNVWQRMCATGWDRKKSALASPFRANVLRGWPPLS